jgi:5-formyltetrahydrofolate cyclo-ligase
MSSGGVTEPQDREPMAGRFRTKDAAREAVWDRLQEAGVARFPFPPHGRIPNFAGAREAAQRLFEAAPFDKARCIKVNPDSPQQPLRAEALRRGIVVLVPTPRLAGGFKKLDPRRIPAESYEEAAALKTMDRWAKPVALTALPVLDAIVAGSVAVTRDGRRCGKGAGFSDFEFAILRELGRPPVPVATTVHPLQLVDSFPVEANDLPLSLIVTPEETIRVAKPLAAPEGIDWDRLDEAALDAMPVLRQLKELKRRRKRRA